MPPLNGSNRHTSDITLSNTNCNNLHNNNNNLTMPILANSQMDNEQYYTCRYYAPKVLKNLNALRRNTRFCDVEIIADGKLVKAHRAVLAASSPYFHAMFTGGLCEQQQNSIELHSISARILDVIMEFIYTGEIHIDQFNVQELMVAADMLELQEVVKGCTDYLKRELHATNAVGIYRFAEGHNFEMLTKAAVEYIETHFPNICIEEEFFELPKEQLMHFITSEYLQVDSEFQVFQAAVRWITQDILQRRPYVFEILRYVRIPLLPIRLLEQTIAECTDGSLKVALRSIRKDLVSKKGSLVPLYVHPRLRAKKDIYVIGGSKREITTGWNRTTESTFESVEKFDTFRREWGNTPPITISRILPGVATLNGKIYVVGGEQDSRILANAECYDPQEEKWTIIAPLIVPRCEFGMCALNGYLYAIGGWIGEDIDGSIERYDPMLNKWQLSANCPEPRFSMGVVSHEGLIYIVGGCSHSRRHLPDLLSYNPVTNEWNKLPGMKIPRSQMGYTVFDGYLYVVGGMSTHYEVLESVERYSFKENKWSSIPDMKIARAGPAVAAVDGLLYVIGGDQTHDFNFFRDQITISAVECYDPLTETWNDCPPLPESRSEAKAVVV